MPKQCLYVFIAVALLVGCSNSPIDSSPSANHRSAALQQNIVACRTSADCNRGETCVFGVCMFTHTDGISVHIVRTTQETNSSSVDTGDEDPPPDDPPAIITECNDGDSRFCGSNIGACKYGKQSCKEGYWSPECVGDIRPSLEWCNNIDDDCDGSTDEDTDSECSDSLYCNGEEQCSNGHCSAGTAIDCASSDNVCNFGTCSETEQRCVLSPRANGTVCDDGLFCTLTDACQGGECRGSSARDCNGVGDRCHSGICDEIHNACITINNGACNCNDNVDADFDGSNQCYDCDDTNGAVSPTAAERCNGMDDDCDGAIDEDFDSDHDGYSVCSTDPVTTDCDDRNAAIHPGAQENCGVSGTGNGVDDNCNGYIDETCNHCDPVDHDQDGFSACAGDCDDTRPQVSPTSAEICDGLDNDCNLLTVQNCDVSQSCHWAGDRDTCREDLLCGCQVDSSGRCSNRYLCTSMCNSSSTGSLGDTCQSNEICGFDILRTANLHGCARMSTTQLGQRAGGVACTRNSDCRSNYCAVLFSTGTQRSYCWDYCGSDAYCQDPNTVCSIVPDFDNMDAYCWPKNRPGIGPYTTGDACWYHEDCDHGFCATNAYDSDDWYCSEPCCSNNDCGAGFSCGLAGDAIDSYYIYTPENGPICDRTTPCPNGMSCDRNSGLCYWALNETVPICQKLDLVHGNRQAGAACIHNSDCLGNFCEQELHVCVDVCCNNSTCPAGLSCEMQYIQSGTEGITQARVCVNQTTSGVLQREE